MLAPAVVPGTEARADPPSGSPVALAPPAVPNATGTAGGEVPAPVVLLPQQVQWNTVRVTVRSQAPHWTLRACSGDGGSEPAETYAEGTGERTVDVHLVEEFDWSLMDGPTHRTSCAEAVSDDL